ncbi:hypothetical protein [Legionella waltersii]|uniref:Uncharacterized protein n=1 Tax=Legionella waltersii TaxID=66969 RepID=A0A0W1A578_9GAMM|nr:hypothetical protein [Legionella waltersii]KTD76519.1 hypothetical protein Lwal_2241 [Legionella waltersii]SNU93899.1 Uncharacterised protein [Legionella waltersii]
MGPTQLLRLIGATKKESYTEVQQKYQTYLESVKLQEKLKKKGAIDTLAHMDVQVQNTRVTSEEIQAAWKEIDSELKFNRFRSLSVKATAKSTGEKPPVTQQDAPKPLLQSIEEQASPQKHQAEVTHTRKERPSRKPTTDSGVAVSTESVQQSTPMANKSTRVVTNRQAQPSTEHPSSVTKPKTGLEPVRRSKHVTFQIATLNESLIGAIKNYKNYHLNTGVIDNRGQGAGIFSFFRHGKTGLQRADELLQSLRNKDESTTLILIAEFMSKQTAYHHHSLTSYLADALADNGLITAHKGQRYSKEDVVTQLSSTPTLHL